ncbi:MAG: substrate-binding domain-containing protein [Eubacteriales bacterium]|nr:substrate-binding domain-containing protein [Eubacteriales bacterium]
MKRTMGKLTALIMAGILALGSTGMVSVMASDEGEKAAPELDVKEIYGKSPDGEAATLATELKLTDEEMQKIKDGNFKVAICMHQMDNNVNTAKVDLIKSMMEENGVEVIAVTDGQSKVETMISNLETTIAMKPDLIISIAYDVNAMVPVFEAVRDAGIKMVFFECAPSGFKAGEDYAALVSTDYYGNGRFAAEYMAYLLDYKGQVGIAYYDADVWTCNQRDQAFRDVMEKYPDIEVVADQGYAEITDAGIVADAILAQNPEIDGIYATWDTPSEEVMASAQAAGRDDLIITTVDLGENSSRILAENGMIKAIGSPRSYEDGKAIAMAALYALIDKDMGAGFIATPTMGVTGENVLEAYKTIYNTEPSEEIKKIWEENHK